MKNCIAVDWLQCHVQVPRRDFENLFKVLSEDREMVNAALKAEQDSHRREIRKRAKGKLKNLAAQPPPPAPDWVVEKVSSTKLTELDNRYQLERTGFQTRNFKAIFEIKDRVTGEDIAVLAAEPRSEMCMKEDSGLIKIINKYLYQEGLQSWVQGLFTDLRLVLINITRLDIAYDFCKFDTMECKEFIHRFASTYYMKTVQNKMKMMGDTWSVDKGMMTGGISSLKFGMETSDINYYLYNKSLELKQVKHKPWIEEHWMSNGWDKLTDVWRLEFSLHATTDGMMVVDEHGELKVHHFKNIDMLSNLEQMYSYLFNKHFCFVKTEKTRKGNYRKQSRCERVVLFHNLIYEGVKIRLSNKKDSGRSSKIFAKKLMQLNQELRGQDFDMAIAGNEMMTWVIKQHALETWAEKKLPGITYSQRVVDLFATSKVAELHMEVIKETGIKFKIAQQQGEDLRATERQIANNKIMEKLAAIPAQECKGCGQLKCQCLF